MRRSQNNWQRKNIHLSGREGCQTRMIGKRISSATPRGVSVTVRGNLRLRGPLSRATGALLLWKGGARARKGATGGAHTLGARLTKRGARERAERRSLAGAVWAKGRRRAGLAKHNKQTFARRTTRSICSTWKLWKISARWPRTSRLQIKISISLNLLGCTNPWRVTSSTGVKYSWWFVTLSTV